MRNPSSWFLVGAVMMGQLSATTVHDVKNDDDLRKIERQSAQNPFRYPGIWSVQAQDPFTANLPAEAAPESASTPLPSAATTAPRFPVREERETSSPAFLRKMGSLLPAETPPPRAPAQPEAALPTAYQSSSESPAPVHYLHPYLVLTAPFLTGRQARTGIFPGDCSLHYRTITASAVLLPYDEIDLDAGSNQGVKPGELFKIYEVGDDYASFSGAADLGRLVRISGIAQVKRVAERYAVASLIRCFGTISRQSRAAPLGELPTVRATGFAPVAGALRTGRIVWVTPPNFIPQPFSQIIIDRGSDRGFQPGDFVFVFNHRNGAITDKLLGDAVVLRADPHSASLLLEDVQPGVINPGDFVVAGYSAQP